MRDWSASIQDRLRRQTTSGRFYPEIDSLRFVAILGVVIYHVSGLVHSAHGLTPEQAVETSTVYWLIDFGKYGVHLFFILSGFILAQPFARSRLAGGPSVALRSYYLRRVTRLEPPYVLATLLCALGLAAIQRPNLGPHLLASLAYLHGAIYNSVSTIIPVAWTLEVEIQFYLAMPFMAMLYRIQAPSVRRFAALGLIGAFALLAPQLEGRIELSLIPYLPFFLAGMVIADLSVTTWADTPAWWRRVPLRSPWIATIGGMCYSIYLVHMPVISLIGRRGMVGIGEHSGLNMHLAIQCLLLLPVILALSTAFYVMIERPCMASDWPAKLASRLRRGLQSAPLATEP